MSDDEWSLFERFILAIRDPNGLTPANHCLLSDGKIWTARTGLSWRDLPEEFGKWPGVYRQVRRWTLAGLWEDIQDALNQSGAVPSASDDRQHYHPRSRSIARRLIVQQSLKRRRRAQNGE